MKIEKSDLETTAEVEVWDGLHCLEDHLRGNALSDLDKENFDGSAKRVFRMYRELSWPPKKIAEVLDAELHRSFPSEDQEENGMVVHGPVVLNSMCPHHFMPVRYHAFVGYLPKGGKVLGISKLSRVTKALGKQFVLQEQLAKYIADAFYDVNSLPTSLTEHMNMEDCFSSFGSIVTLVGVHTCQSCRGVESDARTLVVERRGGFRDSDMEMRFNQQVEFLKSTIPFGG